MNVLVIIIIVVVGVVIYKRNTPEVKKKRAAEKAYYGAKSRRCIQFASLDLERVSAGCKIAFKEYTTFRHNGESVSNYFDRVSFNSLSQEVKLWYYW
ncbi:hypothetical protein [Viscerimonas tarda]